MTLPQPRRGENYRDFTRRFLISKEAKKEYPEIKQRFAVMASTWRNHHKGVYK